MKYGLEEQTIFLIFGKYPEVEEVILYGSRAKGNFKPPDFVIGTPKLILSGDQWRKQPLFISQQHDLTLRFPIRRMNGDC